MKRNLFLEKLFNKQKAYFLAQNTRAIDFRIQKLKNLSKELDLQYDNICNALRIDLNKSPGETFLSEYLVVQNEITHVTKNLKKWSIPKKAKSNLMNILSKSVIVKEPFGVVLIMSPWNYPFQLSFVPLIDAISAGNTVILYLSPYTPAINKIIRNIIDKVFSLNYVSVVEFNQANYQEIMQPKYDYVFFTGSLRVGKIIMKQASENLIPVTLELGGKCPCFVAKTANLKIAARRIARGKWMNSGQTCVSPDYLLIHESIKNVFLKLLKKYIIEFYGEDTIKIQSMSKIINLDHFNRLKALFGKRNKIFYGGRFDEKTLSIEPTIVQVKNLSDPLMNEEIFGPILPYIVCKDFSGIIKQIRDLPKPLALYVFSKNKECINDLLTNVQSGDVCINDTIMHITNYNLPFGGVGSSGMGSYHGIFGFNSFSHTRSLVNTTTKLDPDLFYPPWTDNKIKLLKKVL